MAKAAEFAEFEWLAKERWKAAPLDVWDGDPNNQSFRLSLESAVHQLGDVSNWRNASGKPLKILAGYLERMMPNAFADREGATHLVCMHTALFAAVSEFAMFCFTQRAFFADVGDPSMEASPAPPGGSAPGLWLLRFTMTGGRVEDHHRATLTPRDPVRFDASIYLGLLMARFAWFHEYAHCLNGHVAYAQETGLAMRLHEVAERAGEQPSESYLHPRDNERRCLELDADEVALRVAWEVQANDLENFEPFAQLPRDLRKRLTLFAAYAMTWLFEEFQNFMDSRSGRTHPEPYLRLHNMLHLSRQLPSFREDRGLQESVRREFDHITSAVPNMYRSDDLARDMADPALLDELVQLLRQLDELRPDLADYRYLKPPDGF